MTEATTLYCYNHPARETALRCNNCNRPICASCAVRTPTGYRCKDCVRERQKVFDTATWTDYLIVFVASSILSGLAAVATIAITSIIWGFFIIFLAPPAGAVIGSLVRRFIKNRRARALNFTLVGGMIAGALPVMLLSGLPGLFFMLTGGADVLTVMYSFGPILWQIVYLALGVPAAFYQFSGLVFRR
ncbi:MAG: hypothetical protein AB1607_15965 [Chloroflexota bacterium]